MAAYDRPKSGTWLVLKPGKLNSSARPCCHDQLGLVRHACLLRLRIMASVHTLTWYVHVSWSECAAWRSCAQSRSSVMPQGLGCLGDCPHLLLITLGNHIWPCSHPHLIRTTWFAHGQPRPSGPASPYPYLMLYSIITVNMTSWVRVDIIWWNYA